MDKRSLLFIIVVSIAFLLVQFVFFPQSTPKTTVSQTQNQVQNKIDAPNPQALPSTPILKSDEETLPSKNEFYVLENDYLQVVFSEVGGAIAEINLPFKSKENIKSIVNPIEEDRLLEKDSPQNDLFPNNSYTTFDKKRHEK